MSSSRTKFLKNFEFEGPYYGKVFKELISPRFKMTINQSKKNDPRFIRKWRASGASSTGNKHFDKCMASAARFELEGKVAEAGCMRVAAGNDYSNWKAVPKPPLGELVLLHQAYEGTENCLHCGKPTTDWKPMEKCPPRYEQKTA